jgi:hypothetical protein
MAEKAPRSYQRSYRSYGTFAEATRENIRLIVDAYREATGASLSAVSKRFYGNASFLKAFLDGEKNSMSIDRLGHMLDEIRSEWPDGVRWPACKPIQMSGPARKRSGENNSVESATCA